MFQLRPQQTLESADLGWLKARHHVAVTPEGNFACAVGEVSSNSEE